MQNEVFPFYYNTEENKVVTVRTVKDSAGNVWFVAKDVCDVLEIADHSSSCRRLDDDEKGTHIMPTPGGKQEMLTVNESGLYSLIFTSNKTEAKKFRKWVTSEVLPALRKTGHYEMPKKEEKHPVPVTTEKVAKIGKRSRRGIPQGVMKAAEKVLERTGLDDFQMTLALDDVVRAYTGESILEIVGIRAVEKVDFNMDDHEGIWTRKVRWTWEHDLPQNSNEWGALEFNDDGTYYPVEG